MSPNIRNLAADWAGAAATVATVAVVRNQFVGGAAVTFAGLSIIVNVVLNANPAAVTEWRTFLADRHRPVAPGPWARRR